MIWKSESGLSRKHKVGGHFFDGPFWWGYGTGQKKSTVNHINSHLDWEISPWFKSQLRLAFLSSSSSGSDNRVTTVKQKKFYQNTIRLFRVSWLIWLSGHHSKYWVAPLGRDIACLVANDLSLHQRKPPKHISTRTGSYG